MIYKHFHVKFAYLKIFRVKPQLVLLSLFFISSQQKWMSLRQGKIRHLTFQARKFSLVGCRNPEV